MGRRNEKNKSEDLPDIIVRVKHKFTIVYKVISTLIFLVFFASFAFADEKDTLHVSEKLNEVVVFGNRTAFYSEDCKVIRISKESINKSIESNLGDLLNEQSLVRMVSYGGEGSLSTVSLRGGAARHTQVLWNGIPINSSSTGAADVSMLPAFIADEVELNFSAPSALFGSGSFGGAIGLSNLSDWSNSFSLKADLGYGSFNTQNYVLKTSFGNTKVQTSLLVFKKSSDADFSFYNAYKDRMEKRIHNETFSYGSILNGGLKLKGNFRLNYGVWYQLKDKNIAPLTSSYTEGTANQSDKSLKAYIDLSKVFKTYSLAYNLSYLHDYLLYSDLMLPGGNDYKVYSEFNFDKVFNDLKFKYYWNDKFTFELAGTFTSAFADVQAYQNEIQENEGALIAAIKYQRNQLVVNASFREHFNAFTKPKSLYSVGLKKAFLKERLVFRTNLASKFRLPTFNDRYWVPGGNPDLQPEYGWTYDFSMHWKLFEEDNAKTTIEINPFITAIKNWIQWVPDGSYWVPASYQNVEVKGVDFTISNAVKFGRFLGNLDLNASLSETRIVESKTEAFLNKQLPYTPFFKTFVFAKLERNQVRLSYDIGYNGFSYLSAENSSSHFMPGFWLTNIGVTKIFKFADYQLNASLKVKNLFNASYQIIKEYPMPGRAFYLNIGFKI